MASFLSGLDVIKNIMVPKMLLVWLPIRLRHFIIFAKGYFTTSLEQKLINSVGMARVIK
jgi:hypothetical protein